MKRIIILLLFSLSFITGCETKEETSKKEYIAMKNDAFNETNYKKEELPFDIVTTINRVDEEEVNYQTKINNPKENMHNVKVLLVHNYYSEDIFPTIGVFDEPKELLLNNNNDNNNEIILKDTIKTTTNLSKLNLELKMLIEYTNDSGEKKDIYYKTT